MIAAVRLQREHTTGKSLIFDEGAMNLVESQLSKTKFPRLQFRQWTSWEVSADVDLTVWT